MKTKLKGLWRQTKPQKTAENAVSRSQVYRGIWFITFVVDFYFFFHILAGVLLLHIFIFKEYNCLSF